MCQPSHAASPGARHSGGRTPSQENVRIMPVIPPVLCWDYVRIMSELCQDYARIMPGLCQRISSLIDRHVIDL